MPARLRLPLALLLVTFVADDAAAQYFPNLTPRTAYQAPSSYPTYSPRATPVYYATPSMPVPAPTRELPKLPPPAAKSALLTPVSPSTTLIIEVPTPTGSVDIPPAPQGPPPAAPGFGARQRGPLPCNPPQCLPGPIVPSMPKDPKVEPKDPKVEPKDPKAPVEPPMPPAPLDTTPAPPGAGTALGIASAAPGVIGDFAGYRVFRTRQVLVTERSFGTPVGSIHVPVTVQDPLASRAGDGFKIADDNSPRPTDRFLFSYNYFHGLTGLGGFNPGGTLPSGNTFDPAVVAPRTTNVHRGILGFEKTFWDKNASIQVRVPFFHDEHGDGFTNDTIGNLTVVSKFALWNSCDTGNVFSVGLAVTAPTGPAIDTTAGNINSTLLQPYFGYILNLGHFYFQGFSAVVVPTNTNDLTVLFNDMAIGYRFTREGCWLAGIVPTVEAHATNALNRSDVIAVSDIVSMTGGVHFLCGHGRARLTLGAAVPVTGPRPYQIEPMIQLSFCR